MKHHYDECYLCMSGYICDDSTAAPPVPETDLKPSKRYNHGVSAITSVLMLWGAGFFYVRGAEETISLIALFGLMTGYHAVRALTGR